MLWYIIDLLSSCLKAKLETEFSICLINGTFCLKKTPQKSYETILPFIQEGAGYGENVFLVSSFDFQVYKQTLLGIEIPMISFITNRKMILRVRDTGKRW